MKKVELLIPVGNYENLIAAISNGADAVYLGGKKFGARAFSNNFDEEGLKKASKICHLYNVKIYVTVNTMIYNKEIEEILNYISFLESINIDALIVQDLGLISLIKKYFPNIEIHISTQAHNYNKDTLEYYKKIGCSRVVLARELSLSDINKIDVNIEKEIFVYGALCVCYSGNCLMSALNGGRSANRGECVGSCRLPYERYSNKILKEQGYLLSTKDLNTIPNLKEILDSNITSLKVEGRMKSKEYVAIVTKTFRQLIDNYYQNKIINITEENLQNLKKVFNREYTNGYLFNASNIINKKTSNHQGTPLGKIIGIKKNKILIKLEDNIYQEDAIRFTINNKGMYINSLYDEKGLLTNKVLKNKICMIDNKFKFNETEIKNTTINKTIDKNLNNSLNINTLPKIDIEMNFWIKDTEAYLNVSSRNKSITINKNIVFQAQNKPIDNEMVKKQLIKTGQTPFICQNITIDIPNNIFINIKDLNELRRQALNEMENILSKPFKVPKDIKIALFKEEYNNKPQIAILVRTEEQLQSAIKNNVDFIYINNLDLYKKYHKEYKNIYLTLNRIIKDEENYKNENLLCSDFSSVIRFGKNNHINSNYFLNIANDYAIQKLANLNVNTITLSLELTEEKLNNIKQKNKCEIVVYGLPECMIIKNNIFNINNSQNNYLKNTKNDIYKIYEKDNYTYIMNHQKINLICNLKKLKGFKTYRIELFDESREITDSIIKKVKNSIN